MKRKKHYLRTTKNLYYIDEKPDLRVFYSYSTPVALRIDGVLKVSENQWSITTGRHLTWIDGGNKKARLKAEDFNKLLKEHKPAPDFLKTVSLISTTFGLMCQNEDQKKVNDQKKRFFNQVEGLNFPDNWNELPEDEKTRRLNQVETIGLKGE